MFNIIKTATGESITAHPVPAKEIADDLLFLVRIGYDLSNYIVQADCESKFSITAKEWLGIIEKNS